MTKYLDVDGSVSICPLGIMCEEYGCMAYTYCLGGVNINSTTIQCVHEQSLPGICIFPALFASNGSPMYKSLTKTKTKNTQSLKHMKASANAILKHYKTSVKSPSMVLRFFKS